MNASLRPIGIIFIVGGALALIYGGFTYPKFHEAKLGSLAVSVKTNETVDVPVWGGVGAVLLGGILLLMGGRKGP
jgi:hypothetical protein